MISKKLLLLLASVGLLAGCGEQPTPTPDPDPTPTDPELPPDDDDGMYDIKIVCNPIYKEFALLDTNAVWLGTGIGGENGDWAVYKLTKQDDGTWTIDFKDVELGSYGYSFYLAEVDSTNIWNEKYMNAETVDNKPRSFIVDSDKTFSVDATFNAQPVPTENSLTVSLTVTNFVSGWEWPKIVIAPSEGSSTYQWISATSQDGEDQSHFRFSLKNLDPVEYKFYFYVWYQSEGKGVDATMYNSDGSEFLLTVAGATVISVSGTLEANNAGRGSILPE